MRISRQFLPSINLLSAFEAAATTLNFSQAARELDLTQSAVSRQIKALEEQLGVPLFIRDGQRVRLTTAGEGYLHAIREALKKIAGASIAARSNSKGGTLELAVLPTFGARWLAPRLARFFSSNPGVTVNFTTKLKPFDFGIEPLDAAIHFGQPVWADAETVFLMNETVLPVCSPEFLSQHQFDLPSKLLSAPLINLSSRPDAWAHWFETQKVEGHSTGGIVFDQFAAAAQAATHSVGIALLPEFLIERELADGKLVSAFGAPQTSAEAYYLVWPARRNSYPPLVAFKDWVVSETVET
ncbi:MAG: LysR family transcriptional regulator [Rhodobacteraceae bacterium]|nr:LysR family transcriptional regulator [Paracoccaceae bacterium]